MRPKPGPSRPRPRPGPSGSRPRTQICVLEDLWGQGLSSRTTALGKDGLELYPSKHLCPSQLNCSVLGHSTVANDAETCKRQDTAKFSICSVTPSFTRCQCTILTPLACFGAKVLVLQSCYSCSPLSDVFLQFCRQAVICSVVSTSRGVIIQFQQWRCAFCHRIMNMHVNFWQSCILYHGKIKFIFIVLSDYLSSF